MGRESKGFVSEMIRLYLLARNFTPSIGSITGGDALAITSAGVVYNRASGAEAIFSGAAATWSNMPLALTEIFGSTIRRRIKDLRGYTQWRLAVDINTGAISTAVLGVQYSLDSGSTFNGLDNGTAATLSTVTANIENSGTLTSAWATLNTAARVADVLLRIAGEGGDGATDPSISTIAVEFR
jgi:hypothetical protein